MISWIYRLCSLFKNSINVYTSLITVGTVQNRLIRRARSLLIQILHFPLNIFPPFLLFVAIFLMSGWFQKYYIAERASKNILSYIFGYWSGTFPLAITVYLSYIMDTEHEEKGEEIFYSKVAAAVIGASVLISSIRIVPKFSAKIGLSINQVLISEISLNLLYLLPAILIIIFYREVTFSSGILPESFGKLQKEEIVEATSYGTLMVFAFGVSTYAIENFLIQFSLPKLFLAFYGLYLAANLLN